MAASRSRFSRFQLLVLLFVLPGLIIASYRCLLRAEMERKDRFIETVVDFEEIRVTAAEDGIALPELFRLLPHHGVSSVGISEDTLSSLAHQGRITLAGARAGEAASDVSAAVGSDSTSLAPLPAGALSVHCRESRLLSRIEEQLLMKLPHGKVERLGPTLLRIHKSGKDFLEKVGLGFSPEFIGLARENGLGVVLRVFNHPGLDGDDVKRIIQGFPDFTQVSALIFADEEVLGSRGNLPAVVASLLLRPFRIGLIEFVEQEGMAVLVNGLRDRIPFVRVHSIGRREMDEIYNRPRAIARWVRAVRERRLKMLYMRCFGPDRKRYLSDLTAFNLEYFSQVAQRLRQEGFVVATTHEERRDEVRRDFPASAWYERLLMGTSLMLGFSLLLIASRRRPMTAAALGFGIVAAFAGFILLSIPTFSALAGVTGAIGYSTVGLLWAVTYLEGLGRRPTRLFGLGGFLLRLVTPSLLGGILIAGFHAEADFLLKFSQFRGIKIAFLLPLIWVGGWSLRRYGGSVMSFLSAPLRFQEILIAAVLVGGTALYLLRSGNVTFLKPSELEDTFRTALENLLVARPRNKEFLIGYPAVLFFFFFQFRGASALLPVFLVFAEMGQVSLLNTFCHFHSPLYLAFIRAAHGLWIGLLLGFFALIGYFLFRLLALSTQKKPQGFLLGYFGFGNTGDEILWRTFVAQARRARPDFSWILLHRTGNLDEPVDGLTPVGRGSWGEMLEELAVSRVMVIPGGGVLQSATSVRSLMYYVSLMALAKFLGLRLLLPAQGLGPWARPAPEALGFLPTPTGLSAGAVRLVLELAEYLSLRDRQSRVFLDDLPDPVIPAPVTSDLAFLLPLSSEKEENRPATPLRVGVLLRGKSPATAAILGALAATDAAGKTRSFPVVFQPGEDDQAWEGRESMLSAIPVSADGTVVLPAMDVLITMRLHGAILASLQGIPWIGAAYDPKITGLAEELEWPFVIPLEGISQEVLEGKLSEIIPAHAERRRQLLAKAAEKNRLIQADLHACLACLPGSSGSPGFSGEHP
jgi:polysaccharide pyruvyl transferase CsaB